MEAIADLLSIARLPPGHDPGAGYGVATIGCGSRDRRDPPRPAEVAAGAVPRWRRLVRSSVRTYRAFLVVCGWRWTPEQSTLDTGEGCLTHAASAPGVEIVRGRPVPAESLGSLWLAAGGPAAMIADYGRRRLGRRSLQCGLFVVTFDQHRDVRAD